MPNCHFLQSPKPSKEGICRRGQKSLQHRLLQSQISYPTGLPILSACRVGLGQQFFFPQLSTMKWKQFSEKSSDGKEKPFHQSCHSKPSKYIIFTCALSAGACSRIWTFFQITAACVWVKDSCFSTHHLKLPARPRISISLKVGSFVVLFCLCPQKDLACPLIYRTVTCMKVGSFFVEALCTG